MGRAPGSGMDGPVFTDYDPVIMEKLNLHVDVENGTLTNGPQCWLSFGDHVPKFVHIEYLDTYAIDGTTCDSPYYSMGAKGYLGALLSVGITAAMLVTFFNLRKHGMNFMHEPKAEELMSQGGRPSKTKTAEPGWIRGRRLPWFLLLILGLMQILTGFFAVDIDRNYIQGTAVGMYGVFLSVCPVLGLMVSWEFIRRWGFFEERKLLEQDPYAIDQTDLKSKARIIPPIVFYMCCFFAMFMMVLRNWSKHLDYNTFFELDVRWVIGGIFEVFAFIQLANSLRVTIIYYQVPQVPLVLPFMVFMNLLTEIYQVTVMVVNTKSVSPFYPSSSVILPVFLIYLPLWALTIAGNLSGLARDNEDQVILRLRALRWKLKQENAERARSQGEQEQEAAQLAERRETDATFNEQYPHFEDSDAEADAEEEGSEPNSSGAGRQTSRYQKLGNEGGERAGLFKRLFGEYRPTNTWFGHNMAYVPLSRTKNQLFDEEDFPAITLQKTRVRSEVTEDPEEMEGGFDNYQKPSLFSFISNSFRPIPSKGRRDLNDLEMQDLGTPKSIKQQKLYGGRRGSRT
ncbi:hypothetical protein CKK34_6234 [Yarrowia sp. E02]|nr:hypothetical protein CKK34_6234 [Yarrowia sp. E02]